MADPGTPQRLTVRPRMSNVLAVTVVGVAALAVVSRPPATAAHLLDALGMSQSEPYPIVRAVVNEHLGRIVGRSTYRFDFGGVSDNTPAVITTPIVFEYDDAEGGKFRLPPGRLISIGQYGGWAYDYTIVPQIEAVPLAQAYAVASEVDAVLAGAPRWRRLSGALPALDSLRAAALNGDWRGVGLGRWQLGAADLRVNLKAGPVPRTYFVEVRVFDGSYDLAYLRRTYAIRRARRHGDAQDPLPLMEVLNDPTPVPPPSPHDSADH